MHVRTIVGVFSILAVGGCLLSAQTIATVAGSANTVFPTPLEATDAPLGNPHTLVIDASDNLYGIDGYRSQIFKISPSGEMTTVAGKGGRGFSGDGGLATQAPISPLSMAIDHAGSVNLQDGDLGRAGLYDRPSESVVAGLWATTRALRAGDRVVVAWLVGDGDAKDLRIFGASASDTQGVAREIGLVQSHRMVH